MTAAVADWGDTTLPDRFRQAVALLRRCNMDAAGQRAAADVCLWLLTDRLKFFEDFRKYPIADEKIEKPMFATGEARSGTTLLHALLSVDPHGRALRFWEVMNPSPPPGVVKGEDPRRAKADADWREINAKLPFWLKSHPYNDMLGDGIPECERTWAFDFRQMTPTAWWRVPMGMTVGRLPADVPQQYRLHKMMLQQLQYGRPKKYWVLKGFHGRRMHELFDTYPDARVIWVHRDPVQTAASSVMLMAELDGGISGNVDWEKTAQFCIELTRSNINHTMTDPIVDDPRIHHVRYPDFVADPVNTLRGYYEKFDVPFRADTEAAMRDYLKNNKGDRYGKFKYATDLLRTDIDALHKEFAPFRERFGLEIEKRG
jgi:hypothetical protein